MAWRAGEARSLDQLMPLVYSELRKLAQHRLKSEGADLTLEATEVVHEAYLRLTGKEHPRWQDRSHFFAVASLIMRRVVVDRARKKRALRRGDGRMRVSLEDHQLQVTPKAEEVLAIDGLLKSLEAFDRRKSRVVELRYFAGLTIAETANALDLAPITVTREWRLARAWMLQELEADRPAPS